MKRLTLRSFRRSRTQSPNHRYRLSNIETNTIYNDLSNTSSVAGVSRRRSSGTDYAYNYNDVIKYNDSENISYNVEKDSKCKKSDKRSIFKKLRRRLMNSVKKNVDAEINNSGYLSDHTSLSQQSLDKNRCNRIKNCHRLSKSLSSCQNIDVTVEKYKHNDLQNETKHSKDNSLKVIDSTDNTISMSMIESYPQYISTTSCSKDFKSVNDSSKELTICDLDEKDLNNSKLKIDAHSGYRGSTSTMQSDSYRVSGVGPVYNQVGVQPKFCNLWQELSRLSHCGWYWGPITRKEADEKLADESDGAFLIRDSSDNRYLLSLSFRSHGRVLHTRIEHCNGLFSFYAQADTEGYPTIEELIEKSMSVSQTDAFCFSRSRRPGAPSFSVRLCKPISRFMCVRTLQYWCRFVIRQHVRIDHIQFLPVPSRIRDWIEETQY